jgi:hypothetical protein
VAVVRESHAGRRFLLIGTLVLLVVAAAGYLVWDNRSSIFPNAEDAAAPVVEEDPIARATRLHRAGRTAMAINQLRRVPRRPGRGRGPGGGPAKPASRT